MGTQVIGDILQLRQSLLLEVVDNVFAGLLDGQFGVDDTNWRKNWTPVDRNESTLSTGESWKLILRVFW
jgi:hypothetical protein